MARKTLMVTFRLPGTAAMAIDLDSIPGIDYDVRGARYGVSHLVTVPVKVAERILTAVETPVVGRPASHRHGLKKAAPRIRAAIKEAAGK